MISSRPTILVAATILAALAFAGPAAALDPPVSCGGCWQPRSTTRPWQIQLQGRVDPRVSARFFLIDGADSSAAVVRRIKAHGRGRHVACYVDVGSWESYRSDAAIFPADVLGARYTGFPNERWLDIRRIDVLGPILTARFQACKDKGFDTIDGDNVNGYQQRTGFPLTADDQLRFNTWFANTVHGMGLSVSLKNDPEQARTLARYFDMAVSEQCFADHFCDDWQPFVSRRKPVYEIEYSPVSVTACTGAKRRHISVIFKRQSLGAYRRTC